MKNTKKIISKILIYFALILGVLFCLVPLYWMIRSSLMNTVEVFMMPPRWIPSKFMLPDCDFMSWNVRLEH